MPTRSSTSTATSPSSTGPPTSRSSSTCTSPATATRDGIAARVKANLLDLLPITRASVAVPVSSYSLKDVETVAGYERQLEEYGGSWSMAKYIEATECQTTRIERAAIMDEILAYNREDLEATWAVMEWLRELS